MKNRKSSFYYVVELEGRDKVIVRHSSPGKAIKLAMGPHGIRRASVEDVAMYLGQGCEIKEGSNG